MLGTPAYLLAYLCFLITKTVTYERTLPMCVRQRKQDTEVGRVPGLPDMGTPGDQVTIRSGPLQVRVHPTRFKEKRSEG